MQKKRFYSNENTIVTYNRDRKLNNIIQTAADEIKADIFVAMSVTDLIAVPAFMVIINPESIAPKDMPEIYQFLNLLAEANDTKTTGILFLSQPFFKIAARYKKFIITADDMDRESLRLIMLNRRSAAQRRRNATKQYDRKIFRLMKMILMLKSGDVLRVDELVREFNVVAKTIQRDFRLVETLGYYHKYDNKKKGYILVSDSSQMSAHEL